MPSDVVEKEIAGPTDTESCPTSNSISLTYATPDSEHLPRRKINPWFSAIPILALVAIVLSQTSGSASRRWQGAQAKLAAVHNDLTVLDMALSTFNVDTGRYPTTAEGLQAVLTAPPHQTSWHGPYIGRPPKDPWGNLYVYRFPTKTGFDLRSAGPDGIPNTADDIIAPTTLPPSSQSASVNP